MNNNRVIPIIIEHNLEERKELVQDVVDRLLSNPDYKNALEELNKKYPAKNYNRRLTSYRKTAN